MPIPEPPRPPLSRGPGAGGSSAWPDTLVDKLKRLWADDSLSAAVIARQLGVSRNAVLGKVHRLGLSNRRAASLTRAARTPRPPRPPRAPRPTRSPKAAPGPPAAHRKPSATVASLVVDVGPGLVGCLEDLPRHGCHWPLGDPADPGFRFCGRRAERAPYCEGHRLAAYRPGGAGPVEALVNRFAGV